MASVPPLAFTRGHSIFDCPEQIQTSPTNTLLKVSVLFPAIVIANGPPALKGPISVCHRPEVSAVVLALLDAKVTETCSPGWAVPQIRTLSLCCRTMLSPMIEGTCTSACTAWARTDTRIM